MKKILFFLLLNVSFFISKAQEIAHVSPNISLQELNVKIEITGLNTIFQQGSTTVYLKQGSSTINPKLVNVYSPTFLDFTVDIISSAFGFWDVVVDYVSLDAGFEVVIPEISLLTIDSVYKDQIFELYINTSSISTDLKIISYEFDLNIDTSIVSFLDYSIDNTISAGASVVVNSTDNLIKVSGMSATPLSGEYELLKLSFTANEYGHGYFYMSNFKYNEVYISNMNDTGITIIELVLPSASIEYSDLDSKVNPGTSLDIIANFNKSLAASPDLKIAIGGADTLVPQVMTKISESQYVYNYIAPQVNGEMIVYLLDAQDYEGNTVVKYPISGGTFDIDAEYPSVSVEYSLNPAGLNDSVLIIAKTSEAINDIPILKISLNGANYLPPTVMSKFSVNEYRYLHEVTNGKGDVSVSFSNAIDLVGNSIVENPISGNSFTIDALRYGDVSDNEEITAYDAALVLQYSVDGIEPNVSTPWEEWRILQSDVDLDSQILAYDASLILQYSAGIISSFPSNKKISFNNEAVISFEVTNSTIKIISSGDVYALNANLIIRNDAILGTPILKNSDTLFDFIYTQLDSVFSLGFCSAFPVVNNQSFMEIPYQGDIDLSINMKVNNQDQFVLLKSTDINSNFSNNNIKVYPNPTKSYVFFELNLNEIADVQIIVYDIDGKEVSNIVSQKLYPRKHIFKWNVNVIQGLYIYKLIINNKEYSNRIIVK